MVVFGAGTLYDIQPLTPGIVIGLLTAMALPAFAQVPTAELYDPTTQMWSSTGALHVARSGHTATLLPDGKILVVGGASYASGSFGSSDSAELYDPAIEAWRTTGSLHVARYSHTATLLPDGRVLVVGGINCEGRSGCLPSHLASAELYDAAKETWTLTGQLNVAQGNHTATLLPDGKVLVAGGGVTCESGLCSPSSLAAAGELYDAATETWTATGNLNQPRGSHTATLLSNGQVLIAGGNDSVYNADFFVSAELYSPPTGRWSRTGDLNTARGNHTATLLPNGQVLVIGGWLEAGRINGKTPLSSRELYDPSTGTWTTIGTPPAGDQSDNAARVFDTATLLPNGQVLIAGGATCCPLMTPFDSAALYDPAVGSWLTTGNLNAARWDHTATLLPNGKVLVVGGWAPPALLSVLGDNQGQGAILHTATHQIVSPTNPRWRGAGSLLHWTD
jgi:hypothetical protein